MIIIILRPPSPLPERFGERQLWNARLHSPRDPTSSSGGCHHFYDHDHNRDHDDRDVDDHDHDHDYHDDDNDDDEGGEHSRR